MNKLLLLIEERRRRYQQHPFIRYLLDDNRTAHERLAYAPFAAHFVLTFAEFNRHFLHEDGPSDDWMQRAVNEHAEEDARHFSWFLHDLQVLGYDLPCTLSEAVRFLWSKSGARARMMGYALVTCTVQADADEKLAIIEAVESMGNVWLESTLVAAREHPRFKDLVYFGEHHLERETGHAIGTEHQKVSDMRLSGNKRARLVPIIHRLFDCMEAFNLELLERVEAAYGSGKRDQPLANVF